MSSTPRILSGIVGFPLHGPAIVVCFAGTLWVTGPGTGDILLAPGQRIEIRGKGRVVVEALEPAVIGVQVGEDEAATSSRSWLGRLFGTASAG